MDDKAVEIVEDYILKHLDMSGPNMSGPMPNFTVLIVRKYETLQNPKYLLRSTLSSGVYYELTHNKNKKEWYLDAYTYTYTKFASEVVKETADKEKRKEQ